MMDYGDDIICFYLILEFWKNYYPTRLSPQEHYDNIISVITIIIYKHVNYSNPNEFHSSFSITFQRLFIVFFPPFYSSLSANS